MNKLTEVFQRRRSSARLWEQLREYFEVRFRAKKYGVPYFLTESKATHGKRPQEQEPRKLSGVEDLNGGTGAQRWAEAV